MSCMALQASEDQQTFVETEPENLNFHFAPTYNNKPKQQLWRNKGRSHLALNNRLEYQP